MVIDDSRFSFLVRVFLQSGFHEILFVFWSVLLLTRIYAIQRQNLLCFLSYVILVLQSSQGKCVLRETSSRLADSWLMGSAHVSRQIRKIWLPLVRSWQCRGHDASGKEKEREAGESSHSPERERALMALTPSQDTSSTSDRGTSVRSWTY